MILDRDVETGIWGEEELAHANWGNKIKKKLKGNNVKDKGKSKDKVKWKIKGQPPGVFGPEYRKRPVVLSENLMQSVKTWSSMCSQQKQI
jgi:hypothetical protein